MDVNQEKNNSVKSKRDFGVLWAGQSLSLLGDQFMVIALPLLATQVIGATAAQAVLLPFALYVPFLLFGLQAGAVVDRMSRLNTMIVCDLIQALIFMFITILALSGVLSFLMLMVLVGFAGTAVVFFQISYTSFIPEIFADSENLQRANSRLFLSESLSKTLGPMVAGPLIAIMGITSSIGLNAVTFATSLLTLLALKRKKTTSPISYTQQRKRGWMRRDIREGLYFVFTHKLLEPVITCGVVYVLFLSMIEASLVLYCVKELKLSTVEVGFVLGATAAGFPIGNLICTRIVTYFGNGKSLTLSAVTSVCGLVLIPVAGSAGSVVALVLASILHGIGEGSFGPIALTMRQTLSPENLLGRVNSVQRVMLWGAIALGSLMAGLATKFFGLSGSLWIGGFGTILCLPVLLRRGILAEITNSKNKTSYPN